MGSPVPLTNGFVSMRRDGARDEMNPNQAWNMVDILPSIDGSANRARFGYTLYGGQVLSGTTVEAVGMHRAEDGTVTTVAVTSAGTLWSQTPITSSNSGSTVPIPIQNPVLYRQKTYFFNTGSAMKYYNGSTVSVATGSPPNCSVATVYKDHLVLAHATGQPQRVYFAAGGDPTTWNTTTQILDASSPVTGLCTLPGLMLVFEQNMVERVRGSIIPGVAGSDFVIEPVANIGTTVPAAIATYQNTAIFASTTGVYQTDGSTMRDLTQLYGVKQEWTGNLNSNVPRCAAVYDGKYVLNTTTGISWVFDLVRGSVVKFSNQHFLCMMNADIQANAGAGVATGTFLAGGDPTNGDAVYDLAAMFGSPGTTVLYGLDAKTAAAYTAFTPTIETPYYKPYFYRRRVISIGGLKRFQNMWVEIATGYNTSSTAINLRTSLATDQYAGTPQTYTGTYATTINSTVNANTSGTTTQRIRMPVNVKSEGIAIKFEYQNATNASSDFRFGTLDLDVAALERSKLV